MKMEGSRKAATEFAKCIQFVQQSIKSVRPTSPVKPTSPTLPTPTKQRGNAEDGSV
jgi:hypothetical protein